VASPKSKPVQGGEAARRDLERRRRTWVPVRLSDSLEDGGRVVVLAPRFQNRLGKGLVRLVKRDQSFRVRLDEFGSEAWRAIDDERTVGEIADMMRARFGDRAEPAEERLAEFLRRLHNAGVVLVTTGEKGKAGFK
jgi:hypothetical protein